ncbi:MAG TPA: LPS assembly protein LptD [Woeseiaceae bacterium]|nr:LPS assembly protein LptD [Woeseiaceae bacterium]
MSRHSLSFAGFALLLALSPARGQQSLICEAPSTRQLAEEAAAAGLGADSDTFEFQAGNFEAGFGDDPAMRMTGGVLVRRGNRLAGAESAIYDPGNRSLLLDGGVRYEDPGSQVSSDSAELSYELGRIRFEGAEFQLGQNNSRGAADVLQISDDGTVNLDGVRYTTCPPESEDWLLQAGDIDLDTREGTGTARDVKLRFKGVPILYSPWLSFPITDARKSGVLTPELGSAGRSGNELRIPWYWNIADNYDATITPRLLSDRGLQVGSEFRYLTQRMDGIAQFEYLANDNLANRNRHLVNFNHRTLFGNGWRNLIDFREASDSNYFEDLGGSLSTSSITHLNRSVLFDFYGDHWSLFGRLQDYQTIDSAIVPEDEPYRRLPQLGASGYWPDRALGMRYSFDGELVYFDRDVGVTGWRVDLAPQVEWPLERSGWFITPGALLEHTRYVLDDTEPGQPDDPSRTLPVASLDAGMILERSMNSSGDLIQTLEPRVLYVHVPHRDQSGLPVFDTIIPDLNLVQLFRKNRFLGVDRIADTDQVSVGITSRILEQDSGKEIIRATVGQALYLSDQEVSLPGQQSFNSESSDYIAEVRFPLYQHFNFDLGHQWGTGDNATTQSQARLQYRPASDKILNLSYRFRRDSLEQGDVSWSWPLSQQWNFVGRYNFSFRDNEVLEQFFGLEYESCCWGLRLVSRRHISTRDGTRDSSFGLQLVLKGMTSVGTAADKLLEHGILGYTPDIE